MNVNNKETSECVICKKIRQGKSQKMYISGEQYKFFVCDECRLNKGYEYEKFFDDVRGNTNGNSISHTNLLISDN